MPSSARSGGATATAPRPTGTRSGAKTITREQIAQRAHEIWMKRGCKPGEDERNWLEAEKQLKAEMGVK
jgi:hypothetical protein